MDSDSLGRIQEMAMKTCVSPEVIRRMGKGIMVKMLAPPDVTGK